MTKHEWADPDWRLNVEKMTNDTVRTAPRFGDWGFVSNSSFKASPDRIIRHSSFS
jgi:hypothetical protein